MKAMTMVVAAALLAGCATPYQASGLRGGYTETRLDDNVYQVSFDGNAYVSAQRRSRARTGLRLFRKNAMNPPFITNYIKPSSRHSIVCFKERKVVDSLRRKLGLD